MRLQFGDCTLDLETRELLRSGKAVAIEPKAFQLLKPLVRERPKVLSKNELQEELWPKTFVSERNRALLVLAVPKLIGDSAREPRFLRTVHGYGYACSGEAVQGPRGKTGFVPAVQCLIWGEREIALADGENVLGRDPGAVVWIDRHSVSRRHARIVVSGGSATLEDLGSKNGTYVGGRRIAAPVSIASGEEIRIGSACLVFRVFRATGTTASKVTL